MTEQFKGLLAYIDFCFPESYKVIKEKNLISENLFSPFNLELPKSVYSQAAEFVDQIYKIKESSEYQSQLELPNAFDSWPTNESILTCFDFHYTEEQGLKLIEINTNASLYLPSILQRCFQADKCEPPQFEFLLQSFQAAFDLKAGDGISILDEVPENEGLYFEFLIFQEWFKQKGYDSNIVSLKTYPEKAHSNIYNRYNDFYLRDDKSAHQTKDYFSKLKKFSPHPREYFLLADKARLQILKDQLISSNSSLQELIPTTKKFKDFESADQLWSQRKKYFFKPGQSYGSKAAFSGKSISRKAFDGIYDPEFIAQELCPAGKRKFEFDNQEVEMKFDLRFFTFQGKVQNYTARLYQGQTTNMKTPLGGLAPILFTE